MSGENFSEHAAGQSFWDVACLGEVLWDVATDGEEFAGGAPANVAFHAAQGGGKVSLLSRVGCDERGRRLEHWLTRAGIGWEAGQTDPVQATGIVRFSERPGAGPVYDIVAPAAWDELEVTPEAEAVVRSARVVVFGTLAQRHPVARRAVRSLVETGRESGAVLLADLNLRPPFFDPEIVLWTLRHTDVLKLSREELVVVSGLLGARGSEEDLFHGLLREFGIARGVLSAGGHGAWIFEEGMLFHEPARRVQVLSTTGCGDALVAMLAAALARGDTLRSAAARGVAVAAFVATQPGATPDWTEELKERVAG